MTDLQNIKDLIAKKNFKLAERQLNAVIHSNKTSCNTIHEAILLQAFAIARKVPRPSNEISLTMENANISVSEDDRARIGCSVTWLQKAMAQTKLSPKAVFSISSTFIQVIQEIFSCPTDEIIQVGIDIADQLDKITDSSNAQWIITFDLTMSWLISKKRTDSTILMAPTDMIIRAANCIEKTKSSSWSYMSFITSLASKSDSLSILESTPVFDLLKAVYYEQCTSYKVEELIGNISNCCLNFFLYPTHILLDVAKLMLEHDRILEAKIVLDAVNVSKQEFYSRELDLSLKFLKQVFAIKSISKSEYESSYFDVMAKLIDEMSELNMEALVHRYSVLFWNILIPRFKTTQGQHIIRNLEIVSRCVEKVTLLDVSSIRDLYRQEIARYNGDVKLNAYSDTNGQVSARVANLLSIAATLREEDAVVIYTEAFKCIIPHYVFQSGIFRLEKPRAMKITLETASMLLEIARAVKGVLQNGQKKKIRTVTDPFLCDLACMATEYISVHQKEDQGNNAPLSDKFMFEVYSIKLFCLYEGIFGQIPDEKRVEFGEITTQVLMDMLSITKRAKSSWMMQNCIAYFWKLYCLSNAYVQNESWTEAISNLYQYVMEKDAMEDNDSLIVVICMYSSCQLDRYINAQTKLPANAKGGALKDTSSTFLKSAEDSLKQCTMLHNVNISSLLFIFPVWNRLQQLKTQAPGNPTTASIDFDDPSVKFLAGVEIIPFIKTDNTKTSQTMDHLEDNYHSLQSVTDIPVLIKIKGYQKMAKTAVQQNQIPILVGLLKKILHTTREYQKKFKNAANMVTSWCWLVQLEALQMYSEIVSEKTNMFETSVSNQSALILEELESIDPQLFAALLRIVSNYSSLHLDSSSNAVCFDLAYNFVLTIQNAYGRSKGLKDAVDKLQETDKVLLANIIKATVEVLLGKQDQKNAIKIHDFGCKIMTPHLFSISGFESSLQRSYYEKDISFKQQLNLLLQAKAESEQSAALKRCFEILKAQDMPKDEVLHLYYLCCLHQIEADFQFVDQQMLQSADKEFVSSLDWTSLSIGFLVNSALFRKTKNDELKNLADVRAQVFIEKIVSTWNSYVEESLTKSKAPAKGKKEQPLARLEVANVDSNALEHFSWPKQMIDAIKSQPVFSELIAHLVVNAVQYASQLYYYIKAEAEYEKNTIFTAILLGELIASASPDLPMYWYYFKLHHAIALDKFGFQQLAIDHCIAGKEMVSFLNNYVLNISTDFERLLIVDICSHTIYFQDYEGASYLLKQIISTVKSDNIDLLQYCYCTLASLYIRFGDYSSGKRILNTCRSSVSVIENSEIAFKSFLYELVASIRLAKTSKKVLNEVKSSIGKIDQMLSSYGLNEIANYLELQVHLLCIIQRNEQLPNHGKFVEIFQRLENDQTSWSSAVAFYLNFCVDHFKKWLSKDKEKLFAYLFNHRSSFSPETDKDFLMLWSLLHFESYFDLKQAEAIDEYDPVTKYLLYTSEKNNIDSGRESQTKEIILQGLAELQAVDDHGKFSTCFKLLNYMDENTQPNIELLEHLMKWVFDQVTIDALGHYVLEYLLDCGFGDDSQKARMLSTIQEYQWMRNSELFANSNVPEYCKRESLVCIPNTMLFSHDMDSWKERQLTNVLDLPTARPLPSFSEYPKMSSNQKKVYGGMVSKKATDGKRSEDVEIVKFCEVPVSVVDMQDLSEKLEHLFSVLHEVSDSAKELPTTALLLFGPELLQFNLEKKILRYFSNFKAIIRDFAFSFVQKRKLYEEIPIDLISDNKKEKKEKKKVDGGKTEVEKKGSGPNSMTLVYQSRNPSFKTCHNDIISNFGKATNLQKIERIIEPIASQAMKHFTSPAVTVYYGESLDFESLSTLSHCGNAIILFLYENTLSNRYCPDPVYYALFFSLIGASTVLVSKVHNSESAALKQLIEASTFDWRNGVSQLVNADTTGTNQCELYGLDLKFST